MPHLTSSEEGEGALTRFIDNTLSDAKLCDFLFWAQITEPLDGETIHIYLAIYELDHPAFENCTNIHD